MYQVISLEEGNPANFALIQLHSDSSVRLLRTLNPDAVDGVQGEEYGPEWTISDRKTAASAFLEDFWKCWSDISGEVCGGISLYDNLSEEGIGRFIEMYEHPVVVCNDKFDAAHAILSLAPGVYIFYVPAVYDIHAESVPAK